MAHWHPLYGIPEYLNQDDTVDQPKTNRGWLNWNKCSFVDVWHEWIPTSESMPSYKDVNTRGIVYQSGKQELYKAASLKEYFVSLQYITAQYSHNTFISSTTKALSCGALKKERERVKSREM